MTDEHTVRRMKAAAFKVLSDLDNNVANLERSGQTYLAGCARNRVSELVRILRELNQKEEHGTTA